MPNFSSFCAALNVAWLKKLLDINYIASWKTLLLDTLEGFDDTSFPRRYFCCGSLLLLVLAIRIYTLVQLFCY